MLHETSRLLVKTVSWSFCWFTGFLYMQTAYADVLSYVTFTVDASGTLTCNTSETRVNWEKYSPTRKRISYQNQLLPSEPGKYELTGVQLTVNHVTKQDAGEYHCETPSYAHRFSVAVALQSKEVWNIFLIGSNCFVTSTSTSTKYNTSELLRWYSLIGLEPKTVRVCRTADLPQIRRMTDQQINTADQRNETAKRIWKTKNRIAFYSDMFSLSWRMAIMWNQDPHITGYVTYVSS